MKVLTATKNDIEWAAHLGRNVRDATRGIGCKWLIFDSVRR
jgi:hypothetical protein